MPRRRNADIWKPRKRKRTKTIKKMKVKSDQTSSNNVEGSQFSGEVSVPKPNSDKTNEQLRNLRFVDLPLLQAQGIYEYDLLKEDVEDILQLEEYVSKQSYSKQQFFIAKQSRIIRHIRRKLAAIRQNPCAVAKNERGTCVITKTKDPDLEELRLLTSDVLCTNEHFDHTYFNEMHPNERTFSQYDSADNELHDIFSRKEYSDFDEMYSELLKKSYKEAEALAKGEELPLSKSDLEIDEKNKGSKQKDFTLLEKFPKLDNNPLLNECVNEIDVLRISYSMNKFGENSMQTVVKELCNENEFGCDETFFDTNVLSDRYRTLSFGKSSASELSDVETRKLFESVLDFDDQMKNI